MDLIIYILTLLFAMFFGVSSTTVTPASAPEVIVVTVEPAQPLPTEVPVDAGAQNAGEPTMRVLAVVEHIETLVMESQPVQVQLRVSGYHQDGCEAPVEVVQRRDGNRVTVELYRVLPAAVMCPMVLQPLEETILLKGGFEPGSYTIDVNGVIVQLEV